MLKDIRLTFAIAVGVFGGMTAWSLLQPAPSPRPVVAGYVQQAAYLDDSCGKAPGQACFVEVVNTVQIEGPVSGLRLRNGIIPLDVRPVR